MTITQEAIWAASPTTTRGSPTTISSDPKGERIAYASNKSIFVRAIDDPTVAKQYTQHTSQTTVARFSPSGFYVASGDVSGAVRVWDSTNAESTKGEYHIIAGKINDIAWDGDSQRIAVVGDGKESGGRFLTADSGNSVGEISGHSGQINCVSIRQQRPLRAATGSDDTSLVFYHGAPFKFNTSVRGKHDKYVYGTQFSPDGNYIVTVGADRKIWIYDGKTGEAQKQIGEGEHKGSIFGVSWAADSTRFVTCSGDQTVRIWDVETGKCTKSWRLGLEGAVSVLDQQVGVTWPAGRKDGLIISLDLGGNLNYLQESSDTPVRIIRGHAKAVTAAASTPQTLYTGSADGQVRAWDLKSGKADIVDGSTHSNYVSGIAAGSSQAYSVGWDDTLRIIDESQKSFAGSTAKTDGQPKAITVARSSGKDVTVVVSSQGLLLYSAGIEIGKHQLASPPTAVTAHEDIVVAGSEDKIVRIFQLSSSSLKPVAELTEATSPISSLAFAPTGTHFAAGTAIGKIFVFASKGGAWGLETNRWSAHTARVTSIAWSSDGTKAVSGSLDTNLHAWSLKEPGKRVKALNAHKEGVGAVVWLADGKVLSTGADAAVKVWKVEGVP